MQELAYKGSEFCGASYDRLERMIFLGAQPHSYKCSEWPEWREEVVPPKLVTCKARTALAP